MPDAFVHEWHNQTTLHPLGLAVVLVMGLATLLVPRRLALVPMLVVACFVSPAQRLVIVGLDFNLLRLMVLLGWTRVMLRQNLRGVDVRPLDLAVVAWAGWAAVAYVLLHGTLAAAVNRAGFLFDAVGMYALFRVLVRDMDDVVVFARAAACIAVPVAACFVLEKTTGRNMFSVFGGVPAVTMMRQGALRCQGAFAHPIMAGCFWASLLPLAAGLLGRRPLDRVLGATGLAAGGVVIVLCTSSTPLVLVMLAAAGATLYPLRGLVRWLAGGGAAVALLLHFAMQKPIWHLLARIDLAGGSTGWYRYLLIDEFVTRFDEWALLGTSSTAHWWAYGLGDLTNQYVVEGVRGGLATLLLLLLVIIAGFAGVTDAMSRAAAPRVARRYPDRVGRPGRRRRDGNGFMIWMLGTSLLVHCGAFVAVSYFGQTIMSWYVTLAMIGSLAAPIRVRGRSGRRFPLLGSRPWALRTPRWRGAV